MTAPVVRIRTLELEVRLGRKCWRLEQERAGVGRIQRSVARRLDCRIESINSLVSVSATGLLIHGQKESRGRDLQGRERN